MKITVEISDRDLKDICRITGIKKKGPAIRKMLVDALQLQRRREITQKFVSGEWSVELEGFEESQEADRKADRENWERWHE